MLNSFDSFVITGLIYPEVIFISFLFSDLVWKWSVQVRIRHEKWLFCCFSLFGWTDHFFDVCDPKLGKPTAVQLRNLHSVWAGIVCVGVSVDNGNESGCFAEDWEGKVPMTRDKHERFQLSWYWDRSPKLSKERRLRDAERWFCRKDQKDGFGENNAQDDFCVTDDAEK